MVALAIISLLLDTIATICNGRGSLTPDSEPGLWMRAWGRGQRRTRRGETGKARTWNGQRQGRGVEAEQLLVVKADYG